LTFAKLFANNVCNMKTKGKSKRGKREAFRLSHFTNPSGQIVWRISGTKKDSSRVRENFKTELEAVGRKQELETADLNHQAIPFRQTKLTPEQIADAERAFPELKAGTLLGAVRFFNENFQDPLKPVKLTDAVETFRAEKAAANLRPDTDFLHRINGKTRGKRTIKNDRLALSNFFTWATGRKHCVKNPMDAVAKVRAGSKRPEVFDLPTVRNLLDAALKHEKGKCVPYFVLGLFCGLRPTETERLSWDKIAVTDKLITIDADTAKVTEAEHCNERYVAISENAAAWLLPHSIERLPLGIDRKDFEAVKALAGITTWPQDVLRHTAISNYQAEHKHEGLTAEWAGNSVKVVRKHYRRPIKPADAAAFWAIFPNTERNGNIVVLPKATKPGSEPNERTQTAAAL
jgi:integrase